VNSRVDMLKNQKINKKWAANISLFMCKFGCLKVERVPWDSVPRSLKRDTSLQIY